MKKWDYLVVSTYDLKIYSKNGEQVPAQDKVKLPEYLREAGDDGWEMTGTNHHNGFQFLYFKRPKSSS